MQFHQRQFTRSTHLAFREHGFYISQRDGRGQVDMAVELPYEELLPIRLEYRNTVPQRQLLWVLGGLAYAGVHLARPFLLADRPLPDDVWLWAFGIGAALVAFFLYGVNNWWHQAILHTGRLQLILADHPRDRRQFRDFTERLDAHTKAERLKVYWDPLSDGFESCCVDVAIHTTAGKKYQVSKEVGFTKLEFKVSVRLLVRLLAFARVVIVRSYKLQPDAGTGPRVQCTEASDLRVNAVMLALACR